MKLYGTLKSERATKSQGGNKYLEFRATIGNDPRSEIVVGMYVDPKTGNVGVNISRAIDKGNEYRLDYADIWHDIYKSCCAVILSDPYKEHDPICKTPKSNERSA